MHARADQSAADIVAALERRAAVAAVKRIDVDGIGQLVRLRQFDQPAGHLIIVRPAGILGADRYVGLSTAQIRTDAAHIHRQQFRDIARNPRSAVADFLIGGEQEIGFLRQRHIFILERFQQRQKDRGGNLVVQKAGFDEAARGDRRLRVDRDDIPGLDSQSAHILFIADKLVDPYFHRFLRAFLARSFLVDMHRRGRRQNRTGIDFSLACDDAAIFAIQRRQARPAQPGKRQLAILFN